MSEQRYTAPRAYATVGLFGLAVVGLYFGTDNGWLTLGIVALAMWHAAPWLRRTP
jgi:hypothetical protein